MRRNIQRILIIRTDRIGDVVLSLPVITALRHRYPDACLAMLVHPLLNEIMEDHPDLNMVLFDGPDEMGFRGFFRLVRNIRNNYFDACILLHPTFRLAFMMVLAGIPVRIGTGYRFYSGLFNKRVWEHRKHGLRHETEYNLSLAEKLDVNTLSVEFNLPVQSRARKTIETILNELGIDNHSTIIVIHPGSRRSALDWPLDRFFQLADLIVNEIDAKVVITGTEEEKTKLTKYLQKNSRNIHSLVGRLTLKELIAMLRRADLVVANSTGPLHLAAAVGTRVIGFYPPFAAANARRWGPYGQQHHVFIPLVATCKKCISKKCKYWNCMSLIQVEDVLVGVKDILNIEAFCES